MNTDQTKAEQNFITCATSMQKFMHEYALISSGEFDEIGHTAMKHPVYTYCSKLVINTVSFQLSPLHHRCG